MLIVFVLICFDSFLKNLNFGILAFINCKFSSIVHSIKNSIVEQKLIKSVAYSLDSHQNILYIKRYTVVWEKNGTFISE